MYSHDSLISNVTYLFLHLKKNKKQPWGKIAQIVF